MGSYSLFRALPIGLLLGTTAFAQAPGIPSLFNPRLRPEPAQPRSGVLRILTSDDAPPLNFTGPDGVLVGFNVDLARAICLDLQAACTLQARRADLLPQALLDGAGDAVADIAASPADDRIALSAPYLPRPGRFARRQTAPSLPEATAPALAGRAVGVVAGSPHALFLARFFPDARAETFPARGALLDALRQGTVELVFDDAIDLAFWLNGVTAGGCCAFVSGAFLDAKLFGPGLCFAVRAADDELRRALDGALARLNARGTIGELYLRYFPVPPL